MVNVLQFIIKNQPNGLTTAEYTLVAAVETGEVTFPNQANEIAEAVGLSLRWEYSAGSLETPKPVKRFAANKLNERLKTNVRRDGASIVVDLQFDDCQLHSRLVVGGDLHIAVMVASGELKLNEKSQLVFSDDGTPYHHVIPTRYRG